MTGHTFAAYLGNIGKKHVFRPVRG